MHGSPSEIRLLATWLQHHGSLTCAEIAAVESLPYTVRSFEPGHYLLREGDQPRHCAFLLSGFVYRHKIVGDGGRQIVAIHTQRNFVDVQQALLAHADHNVQALTHGTALQIPTDKVTALICAHAGIAVAVARHMLVETSIAREWLANTNRRDAQARTAHMLCELAVRNEAAGLGPRGTFELPMTQEQLGDVLGLTAVHINRTLKSLTTDGVIVRDKRSVRVTDWQNLSAIGDFTTGYLHLGNASSDAEPSCG